jgi:ParB-like chromosome segregation protein Spo0J
MREERPGTFSLTLDRVFEDQNFNIRLFFGDIDCLAIQLMTEGQREPIKVRQEGDRFFVVDGHRRQRAFARSRCLRIAPEGPKYLVYEGDRILREAPGPRFRDFDPEWIECRLVEGSATDEELFASQLIYNSGKPFTLLERMLFISRLGKRSGYTKEQLALKTGVSRTSITNAQNLNSADPRLLDCVREGRISQKLALRLLRAFPAELQIAKVSEAKAAADRHHRAKLLPKDFEWARPGGDERVRKADGKAGAEGEDPPSGEARMDRVRARLCDLALHLAESARFAPNPVARDRLGTLSLIHQYAVGKLSYARLEAHLFGRD